MGALTTFFNLFKPAKTDPQAVAQINENMDIIDTEMHRPPLTVNGNLPDPDTRNISLETVPLADNLSSDEAQFVSGSFLVRTSGGGASIQDGDASLSSIKGNMVKTGYVPESIQMTVNAVPRVAPAAITATLDAETFEAYVETAGTYTLSYTTEWSADPADYGVTVSNTPVSGDSIVIIWDGENAPEMTVNAVIRPVPAAITATLDRDTFVAYVTSSGTVTLSYTTTWSANPALYGITVSNTPVSGDSIVVVYVKENRGIITTANVSAFNATGWNLYDDSTDMARVVKYSDDYGYKIGGSYSLVLFATTPDGDTSSVNVQNGYFNVPSDGYVLVTGGDSTTYIYPTWSDWTEGYEGNFETYTVDTVDLSGIMANFTAGLCAINDVRDEINFNLQKAISRIERMAYSAENLAAVIATGRLYDTDTNYIYVVRATAVETSFTVSGEYTVSDHGIEFYTASTNIAPVTDALYGENLKDKLRTDVITISGGLVNNLNSTATNKALTAAQGKVLNDKIKSDFTIPSSVGNTSQNIATYICGIASTLLTDNMQSKMFGFVKEEYDYGSVMVTRTYTDVQGVLQWRAGDPHTYVFKGTTSGTCSYFEELALNSKIENNWDVAGTITENNASVTIPSNAKRLSLRYEKDYIKCEGTFCINTSGSGYYSFLHSNLTEVVILQSGTTISYNTVKDKNGTVLSSYSIEVRTSVV